MFTNMDIEHMSHAGFPLDDYSYANTSQPTHAKRVYETVSTGAMPPSDSGEEPWSEDEVQLFQNVGGRRLPAVVSAQSSYTQRPPSGRQFDSVWPHNGWYSIQSRSSR